MKNSLSYIILTLSVLAVGCSKSHKIKGPEYIPREEMVMVLSDLYIMNGLTGDISFYKTYDFSDSIDLYTPIFEKYNIDQEKYEKTINKYSENPDLLNELYDDILMNLQQKLDEMDDESGDNLSEIE